LGQDDVGNPSLHQARVLPRRQRSIWAASTRKQNLPRLAPAAAQIRVERLDLALSTLILNQCCAEIRQKSFSDGISPQGTFRIGRSEGYAPHLKSQYMASTGHSR